MIRFKFLGTFAAVFLVSCESLSPLPKPPPAPSKTIEKLVCERTSQEYQNFKAFQERFLDRSSKGNVVSVLESVHSLGGYVDGNGLFSQAQKESYDTMGADFNDTKELVLRVLRGEDPYGAEMSYRFSNGKIDEVVTGNLAELINQAMVRLQKSEEEFVTLYSSEQTASFIQILVIAWGVINEGLALYEKMTVGCVEAAKAELQPSLTIVEALSIPEVALN